MALVFVSYRTGDAAHVAAAVHERLIAVFGPEQVFRDARSMGPGERYPSTIRSALRRADVVVAVIGPRWLAVDERGQRLVDRDWDWVRWEITTAVEFGIPIVPVLVDDTPLPDATELPGRMSELTRFQVARVRHTDQGPDLDRLAAALVKRVPALAQSPAAAPALPDDPRPAMLSRVSVGRPAAGAAPARALDQANEVGAGRFLTGFAALLSAAALWRAARQDTMATAAGARSDGELLDRAAAALASAVGRQWTREVGVRQLLQPQPLRLRWSSTGRPVSAQPAAVLRPAAMGGRPIRLKLHGDLDSVTEAFRQLPARQLVVLGEPGAGKTVLATLLTLGLLNTRHQSEPVPVLLPASSWRPHGEHLHAWLARRLVEDYPVLANPDTHGPDAAGRLVRTGRVMPVLDGLDELPPALRPAAIEALDHAIAEGTALVVTSRGNEYEAAVATSGRFLSRAAVVEIEPVAAEDTITFLRHAHTVTDSRWQPVFDHLRQHPEETLARALSTPLMVHLARVAYAPLHTNPAYLCDPNRFNEPAAIEDHLLDAYLPGIYATHPTPPWPPEQTRAAPSVVYPPQRAQQWLRFLAAHLNQLHTRDLGWWELDRAVPRLVYGLALAIAAGCAGGLLFGLAGGLVVGQATTGLVAGFAAGFVGGFIVGLRTTPRHLPPTVVGAPRRLRKFSRYTAKALLLGFGIGIVLNVQMGLGIGLAIGVATGIACGLARYTFLGHREWAVAVLAQEIASRDPASLLTSTKLGARTQTVIAKLAAGAGIGIAVGLMTQPDVGLVAGLTATVVGTPVINLDTIWGRFLIARAWLSLRGQLPWSLMPFLDDAHRRGVLRQAGATYQFRHARLQDRLARPAPKPPLVRRPLRHSQPPAPPAHQGS